MKFERNIETEVFPDGLKDGERLFVYFDRKRTPHHYEVVLTNKGRTTEKLIGGNYYGSNSSAEEAIRGIWQTPQQREENARRAKEYAEQRKKREREWFAAHPPKPKPQKWHWRGEDELMDEFAGSIVKIRYHWNEPGNSGNPNSSRDDVFEFPASELPSHISNYGKTAAVYLRKREWKPIISDIDLSIGGKEGSLDLMDEFGEDDIRNMISEGTITINAMNSCLYEIWLSEMDEYRKSLVPFGLP